jgi:hypothetical protein
MGVLKLAERINDPLTQEWYDNIFPKDTQVRPSVWLLRGGRLRRALQEGGQCRGQC